MREVTTSGLICLRDDLDIEYKIARIDFIEREDESFTYVITPCYEVIDLLGPPHFQGIPGLNLDLRKPRYVRDNLVPVFISERSPGKNREDLWQLLDHVGMKHLNQLEWLMRTDLQYFGDPFYVRRLTIADEKQCFELTESAQPEPARVVCRRLLGLIGLGHDVKADSYTIDDSNRQSFYAMMISMYRGEMTYARHKRAEGIRKSADGGNYRGRQRIPLDEIDAQKIFNNFRKHQITEAEALAKLVISRSTFYRRLKEY